MNYTQIVEYLNPSFKLPLKYHPCLHSHIRTEVATRPNHRETADEPILLQGVRQTRELKIKIACWVSLFEEWVVGVEVLVGVPGGIYSGVILMLLYN